jgi:hypothetical protein
MWKWNHSKKEVQSMSKKVELLVTLRGNEELWLNGHVFDYETMPSEIRAEIAMDRGTVRVFEQIDPEPAVPPPAPPEEEPTFSEVAKSLLEEEEKEPSFVAKHKGGGRWVVIDTESGIAVNEGYLKKKEAKDLAAKLEKGEEAPPIESELSGFGDDKPTLKLRDDDD